MAWEDVQAGAGLASDVLEASSVSGRCSSAGEKVSESQMQMAKKAAVNTHEQVSSTMAARSDASASSKNATAVRAWAQRPRHALAG